MSAPAMKRTRFEQNGVAESVGEHFPHFATQAIHAGQDPDQWASKAVVPLISLSTTFKQDTPGKPVSLLGDERNGAYLGENLSSISACGEFMKLYFVVV